MSIAIEYIGASWCAPCKIAKPLAEVLAHKFAVPIAFLDYDEMEEEEGDYMHDYYGDEDDYGGGDDSDGGGEY